MLRCRNTCAHGRPLSNTRARAVQGRPEKQKEIYVNEPMRFGGITIYQVRCTAHCMSASQHCHCVYGWRAPAPCMTAGLAWPHRDRQPEHGLGA